MRKLFEPEATENCLATAPKYRINPFNSVAPPLAYQKCMGPLIFNDHRLFGLALDSFNVRKHIKYVTDMSENDLLFQGKKSVVSLKC